MIAYIFVFRILPLKHDLIDTMVLALSYVGFFIVLGLFVLQNQSARITLAY